MMQHDGAPLRVLYIGGTGTISASCVRLSVATGMSVSVLNRGHNRAARPKPDGVTWLTGDVTDDASLLAAVGDQRFDAVVNFLSYDADDLFQVFTPHGPGELRFDPGYNGVDRRRLVLLRITVVHMYDTPTKQRLFRAVVERFAEAGVRAEDILISVVENGVEDWYAGRL